ncbi:MAG TPA: hypothetical protein VFV70_04880 [Hyphomonadaceae bacterium]|nr:hypothetical protein [Hyphomonadaceae bacterium]
MGAIFGIVGRIISTLLGLLLVFMGVVWILQAYNIAFNGPMGPGGERSFMVEDHRWAIYGAIAILIGVVQIVWSNTRQAR